MAEYFPLLDRAISGLTEPTAEARRSIYERARTALIGQLGRMDPPVPEEDIARESAALDEAIARVEARFEGPGQDAAAARAAPDRAAPDRATAAEAAAAPVAPATVPAPARETPLPGAAPSIPGGKPAAVPASAPPVASPPARERPVLGPRPTASVTAPGRPMSPVGAPVAAPTVTPPTRPGAAARAPLPPRGTRPVMALRPVAPAPARDRALAPALEPVALPSGAAPPESASPGSAPRAATEPVGAEAGTVAPAAAEAAPPADGAPAAGFAAALDAAGRAEPGDAAEAPAPPRPRDPAARPPAPRPRAARSWGRPAVAAGLVAAVLAAGGMGFAAYRLRDRPEQVVAAPTAAADASGAAAAGKVSDRAASGADAAEGQPASGAAVPAPIPQGSDAGSPAPSIAVAQRAALLVDAPEDPQRVRTYVGTVVWHLDSVSPGGGQPLASAVKADVDIPDAKLKVTMLMQKNPEPQLPASHTIEFHFLPQSGNTLGPVKQVNVPEMRRDDDAPTGDPLAGVPVAITDNYFLVGLTRGAAESQNIRLITERNWFDMSLLFSSGKLGKLTFEKGAGGQRVIDDALKAWK